MIWDNHCAMPLRPNSGFMEQLDRLRNSNVNVVSLNVAFDLTPFDQGIHVISSMRRWILERDGYAVVGSAKEILANVEEGTLSIVFDLEGLGPLGGEVDMLDVFYQLGVRWASIAYNKNNLAGGGCLDHDRGLTNFGLSAVERMNELGMVVCGSHCGETTALELIDKSQQPPIFSHSNAAGVYDHPRNISDHAIRACAARGGVIGINGVGAFLGDNDASAEKIIEHIVYVADLVGPQAVGLSLDYAFDEAEMQGLLDNNRDIYPKEVFGDALKIAEPEVYPELMLGLEAAGFGQSERDLILGGNWFRVASNTWK